MVRREAEGRVFGCKAFAHIPKDERKKFDTKARKCILLGYGNTTKGYRLYDPIDKKVIYSRDVKFNEIEENQDIDAEHDSITADADEMLYPILTDLTSDGESETEVEVPIEGAPEQQPR